MRAMSPNQRSSQRFIQNSHKTPLIIQEKEKEAAVEPNLATFQSFGRFIESGGSNNEN